MQAPPQAPVPLMTQSLDSGDRRLTSLQPNPSNERLSSRRTSLISSGSYTQIVSASSQLSKGRHQKSLSSDSTRRSPERPQRLQSIEEVTPSKEVDREMSDDDMKMATSSQDPVSDDNQSMEASQDESLTTQSTYRSSPRARRPTFIANNIAVPKRMSVATSNTETVATNKRKRGELHDSPSSKENFITSVLAGPVGGLSLGAARRMDRNGLHSVSADPLPNQRKSKPTKMMWRQ